MVPSPDVVSDSRTVPVSHTLDRVGPAARTPRNCSLILDIIRRTSSSFKAFERGASASEKENSDALKKLTIGVNSDFTAGTDSYVSARFADALVVFQEAVFSITELNFPMAERLEVLSEVAPAVESFAYHRQNLDDDRDKYGPLTRVFFVEESRYSPADALDSVSTPKAEMQFLM